jgi:hypothetical protein
MIGVIFDFGGEPVEVRVHGYNCFFRTKQTFGALAPIEALKLDKKGVVKEHPDLENDEEWRTKAITRFKDKLKEYNTEMERIKYLINDLKKYGYKPLYFQRDGHRPVKVS